MSAYSSLQASVMFDRGVLSYPELDGLDRLLDLLCVGVIFTISGAITYAVGELGHNPDRISPLPCKSTWPDTLVFTIGFATPSVH